MTDKKNTNRKVTACREEKGMMELLKNALMPIMARSAFNSLIEDYEDINGMEQFEVYLVTFVTLRDKEPLTAISFLQALLKDMDYDLLAELIPVVCGAGEEDMKEFCDIFVQEIVDYWCDEDDEEGEEVNDNEKKDENEKEVSEKAYLFSTVPKMITEKYFGREFCIGCEHYSECEHNR